MRARTLWSLSLLVTALAVGTGVLTVPARHPALRPQRAVLSVAAPAPPESESESCAARALAVLGHWDRRRARAWARGDPAALTRLYAVGSGTARRDLAMLAAYRSRGLRVRSMGRQVLAVHLRSCGARRISLLLTDRLVDAVAVGRGHRTGLPDGRPVIRRVELRRHDGVWRVSEVYER
jgi:hypothetical protein